MNYEVQKILILIKMELSASVFKAFRWDLTEGVQPIS